MTVIQKVTLLCFLVLAANDSVNGFTVSNVHYGRESTKLFLKDSIADM
jgi:hypothetical protein